LPDGRNRRGWLIAATVHVVAIVALVTLPLASPRRSEVITIIPLAPQLPPFAGTQKRHAPAGGFSSATPPEPQVAQAPPPPPVGVTDTMLTGPARVGQGLVLEPALGNGLAWISPRPALPATIADALYGDTAQNDRAAVGRLRAMVDSLNVILDEEQRERQKPTWTTNIAGSTFGIDSQYIHVAGIKIPTALLALLPIRLPEGNYGEEQRARQLEEMRQDLMQAARRTQTLYDFRQYVHELRERKQAEQDFWKREKVPTLDSTKN
jgi:hypothetical protein